MVWSLKDEKNVYSLKIFKTVIDKKMLEENHFNWNFL